MSSIYIAEFSGVAQTIGRGAGVVPVVDMPPVNEQKVSIGSSSNPFGGNTRLIRINVDATCSIQITRGAGTLPAVSVVNMRMPANSTEYFSVQPGSTLNSIANS